MSQFSDLAAYLTTKLNAIINKLNDKVDGVAGKGLSEEDYTTVEKTKLAGITAGAEPNNNDFDALVFENNAGAFIHTINAGSVGDAARIRLKGSLTGAWNPAGAGAFEITGTAQSAAVATTTSTGVVQVGANLAITAGGILSVDTTNIALKTYVDGEITNLINNSPAALDTLNELAAALGDDPNFSTTIINMINQLETDIGTALEFSTYMDANIATIL